MNKKTAVFYWLIAGLIAVLLLLNLPNEKYHIFTEVDLQESEYESGTYHTKKLSVPKGRYRIVLNYNVKKDTTVNICAGQRCVEEGILTKDDIYHESFVTIEKDTDLFHFEFPDIKEDDLEIYNYEIFGEKPLIYDAAYVAGAFLILALIYFLLAQYGVVKKADKRTQTVFLLGVGLIIFTSYPLFTGYLVYSHDLSVHLMRIEGVKSAILDGQWLAVIYPECNNGYGLLGFLYPNLFLYFN